MDKWDAKEERSDVVKNRPISSVLNLVLCFTVVDQDLVTDLAAIERLHPALLA